MTDIKWNPHIDLSKPLHWRKPRRVMVDFDLFRESVPFFFKQWGEYHPRLEHGVWPNTRRGCCDALPSVHVFHDGTVCANDGSHAGEAPANMKRVGKARAGRLLDGREWNEYPEVNQ